MKPTAQYLKHLMHLRVPIRKPMPALKVPGRQVGPDAGFNVRDFDIDAKPPEELTASEIALYNHFGPPIKTARKQDAC